jgi:dolichyl-phosphate-mannose-protein mannosyltransferase
MTGVTTTAVAAPSERVQAPPEADSRSAMPAWGWPAIFAVTAFGGLLRFWRLDRPHKLVFDETYYVKQGYSMFKAGYELKWAGEGSVVDPKWNAGNTDVFTTDPDFVVHPPVGKWMIGLGEHLFGPTSSWGWRFAAALAGTLSILMLTLIARRLFDSTLLGVTAGLLLAVDGEHFVHSRTGLLDIFVMFWALAAFGCFLIDRDVGIRRLRARAAAESAGTPTGEGPADHSWRSLTWWMGVRWWRIAGAVCLGLCIGTKWSGLYFAVVFALMTMFWDAGARRAVGLKHWFTGSLLWGALSGLGMAVIAFGVYLASWTGWFRSDNGYDRLWAADHPSRHFGWIPDGLRSLWYYHSQMFEFHVGLTSPHPYMANPWSWIVMGRPTAFHYEAPKLGERGCTVAQCSEAVTALGNPVVWWGATLALGVLLFQWALRRDWRAGAVLAGLLAGYAPWFLFQQRTIFNFYAIAFTPWVVLAATYALGMLLGPPAQAERKRKRRALAAGGLVILAVVMFWFFLPIYSAQVIPQSSWSARMWLQSWI